MRSLEFHPLARREADEAHDFYEDVLPGLGLAFADDLEAAIERMSQFPEGHPLISARVRRKLLVRFPYGVLYSVTRDGLFIIAVMHQKRHPDYWKKRAQDLPV